MFLNLTFFRGFFPKYLSIFKNIVYSMAFGGRYVNPNKIDHATALLNHIDRISLEVKDLFKKEYDGGNIRGALPKTKITNFFNMVQFLETLLITYVCNNESPKRIVDPLERYAVRRVDLKERFNTEMGSQNLQAAFDAANEWMQILMIEAGNAGLLMKISKPIYEEDED